MHLFKNGQYLIVTPGKWPVELVLYCVHTIVLGSEPKRRVLLQFTGNFLACKLQDSQDNETKCRALCFSFQQVHESWEQLRELEGCCR